MKLLDSIPIDPPRATSKSGEGTFVVSVYREDYEWICAEADKRNMSRVRFMKLLIEKIMANEK